MTKYQLVIVYTFGYLFVESEGHTDAEREAGEEILDYLNLTEKRRHMEAQVRREQHTSYHLTLRKIAN